MVAFSTSLFLMHQPRASFFFRHGEVLDGFYNIVSGVLTKIIDFVTTSENISDIQGFSSSSAGAGSHIPVTNRFNLPLEVGELTENSTVGAFTAVSRDSKAEFTCVTKVSCVVLFIEKHNFQKLASYASPLRDKINAQLRLHREAMQKNDVSQNFKFTTSIQHCL